MIRRDLEQCPSGSAGQVRVLLIYRTNRRVLSHGNSIFKLTAAYKADPHPDKINLGVGAYRDDNSKPWVLPVVKKVCGVFFFRLPFHANILQASQIILNDATLDHEYLAITGLPEFVAGAARLILGENSPAISEGRVVSVQTISGTGANHLGALFLSKYYQFNGDKVIYLSDPTWGMCLASSDLQTSYFYAANHFAIFNNVGIKPAQYPYYDPRTIGLDFSGFVATLQSAPERSVFLLHACAHNPTGVDPTEEQWKSIADLVLEKKHYAFFDTAYQGFASGDLERDAKAVRYFVSRGVPLLVCQVRKRRYFIGNGRL